MIIRHHLSDALLLAHSAGQLPEAFNVVVATHLSMCDECRARAESCDAVGGAVIEQCAGAEMAPGALEATLLRIRTMSAPRSTARLTPSDLPAPLCDYVGRDLSTVKWRPIGMGVRQAVLPTSPAASVRLLHIPAGVSVPDHGHRGMELTLVLRGAFRDQTDRFGPGDIEIADEAMKHKPVAEPGVDCICLAATDAPLRFSGIIPRMAQSIFRL